MLRATFIENLTSRLRKAPELSNEYNEHGSLLAELVAGKKQYLRGYRISPDIPIKMNDTSLKSWYTEYFYGIGLYSEQFVEMSLNVLKKSTN